MNNVICKFWRAITGQQPTRGPWDKSTTYHAVTAMCADTWLSEMQINIIVAECQTRYEHGELEPAILSTVRELCRYAQEHCKRRRIINTHREPPRDEPSILKLIVSNEGLKRMGSDSNKRSQKFHTRGYPSDPNSAA